jgi:hypothetical protein
MNPPTPKVCTMYVQAQTARKRKVLSGERGKIIHVVRENRALLQLITLNWLHCGLHSHNYLIPDYLVNTISVLLLPWRSRLSGLLSFRINLISLILNKSLAKFDDYEVTKWKLKWVSYWTADVVEMLWITQRRLFGNWVVEIIFT